jgi:hypothetical protein
MLDHQERQGRGAERGHLAQREPLEDGGGDESGGSAAPGQLQ